MRLAAERRRETRDRALYLVGIGAVQQQQATDQQSEVGNFLDLARGDWPRNDCLRHAAIRSP
jgi:hypothetical protein